MLNIGSLSNRVEGFFSSMEWGGLSSLDFLPPPPPLSFLPNFGMGFGVGRSFFGSGLLTGVSDFFPDFFGNSLDPDVAMGAEALLGWGNIFDYDPLSRGGAQTFSRLPFPILNAFVPAPAPASAANTAASEPASRREKEPERVDEENVRRVVKEEEAARLKAQEEAIAKQEKAIGEQEEAQKAERAAKEAEFKKLLGAAGGGGGKKTDQEKIDWEYNRPGGKRKKK